MAKSDNTQQLILARQACLTLAGYALGHEPVAILRDDHRAMLAALLEQFGRMDAKEQKQRDAGKLGAKAGVRGGAPKGNQNARKDKNTMPASLLDTLNAELRSVKDKDTFAAWLERVRQSEYGLFNKRRGYRVFDFAPARNPLKVSYLIDDGNSSGECLWQNLHRSIKVA